MLQTSYCESSIARHEYYSLDEHVPCVLWRCTSAGPAAAHKACRSAGLKHFQKNKTALYLYVWHFLKPLERGLYCTVAGLAILLTRVVRHREPSSSTLTLYNAASIRLWWTPSSRDSGYTCIKGCDVRCYLVEYTFMVICHMFDQQGCRARRPLWSAEIHLLS